MKCKVKNTSDLDMQVVLPLLKSLYSFAHERLSFKDPANIFFKSDSKNSMNPLGKTAHYQPLDRTITVYTDGRHLKDILRSISHELIHHDQNCKGGLDRPVSGGSNYAQKDPYMREIEREAYEKGNMIFRDWEDTQRWNLMETKNYTKENEMPEVPEDGKKLLSDNDKEVKSKPTSNDQWYQKNLYKSLMKRWVKK